MADATSRWRYKEINGINALEKETNLLGSKEGEEALANLMSKTGDRMWMYKAYLTILVYGIYSIENEKNEKGQQINPIEYRDEGNLRTVKLTPSMYQRVVRWTNAKNGKFAVFKKTPAGLSGALEDSGSEGLLASLTQMLQESPVKASKRNTPTLVEQALNKIHPKFTETVEKYCILIKSRAYLSMPPMGAGSLQRVVGALRGVMKAFQSIVFNIYKGAMRAIQQFYAYINGIVTKIQKMLVSIIEQIIPLDLICLILEAIQTLLDDVSFFASMFGGKGSFFQYLNTFQSYINAASNLVRNPFSTLKGFIPADIQKIIDLVDQVGSDPNGFLTDQLNNYGYGYVMSALQGNFYGAIVSKYGSKFPALRAAEYFVGRADGIAGGLGISTPNPASMGPNIHQASDGTYVDDNNNPVNPLEMSIKNVINVTLDESKNAVKSLSDTVGKALNTRAYQIQNESSASDD
jgi:hypothetical protein